MEKSYWVMLALLAGYLLDLFFGDPEKLPHPIRLFGNTISFFEKFWNKGSGRFLKGMAMAVLLCSVCFLFFLYVEKWIYLLHPASYAGFVCVFVFYGLANKSLIQECQKVFELLNNKGLEAGRKQLSRIVGRDTANLSQHQIRIAVLETLSENLSDGVIAPLFYFLIGGVPGMMTYKMINTLDSMVGYRNEKFEKFGKFSARLDDLANLIPARLTGILMGLVSLNLNAFKFMLKFGHQHKSPNSGYPEAALAGILNVRFGGPNKYHGQMVEKPYIGWSDRLVAHQDFQKAKYINHAVCLLMVLLICFYLFYV